MDVTSTSPSGHAPFTSRPSSGRPAGGRPRPYDRRMPDCGARPTAHEVLAAVLQIRDGTLQVLAWRRAQRARTPDAGRCPAGCSATTRTSRRRCAGSSRRRSTSARSPTSSSSRCSATRDGCPAVRRVATAFLGLVPSDADPAVPADTTWHPVDALPDPAFDHAEIVAAARDRLRAKLSYTNLGFALAPREFTISDAARALRRRARPSGVGDEPAAGARAPLRPGADRGARRARTGGRTARGAVPVRRADAAGDRRVRGAAGRRASTHGRPYREHVVANLPLFPLSTVLMPGAPLPLHIFEPRYRQLTVDLVTGAVPDKQFGVIAVREGWTPATRPPPCTASAARPSCSTSAGCPTAATTSSRAAASRFRLLDVDTEARPYLMAEVEYLPDLPEAARGRPRRPRRRRPRRPPALLRHRLEERRLVRARPTTSGRPSCPTCSPPTACCPCRTASACWSRPARRSGCGWSGP